jgi:CheY-like chemotaxis protein
VPEVKSEIDASKLPVLVVEDNREALFVYEKYLKGTQFQVIPARDTKEAAKALDAFRPVAIVLDVLLQGEHSWDLLREIKNNPDSRNIPVYVVTVVDNRAKALALGADGFHAKPVDRVWLIDQLNLASVGKDEAILIVDDDETSRYLLRTVLGTSGYRLIEAANARDGFRLATEQIPSLIILDLSMPDATGFEVLRQLKEDRATRAIPVIIHTSTILDEDDRRGLEQAAFIVPKSHMSSRELATASFAEAFDKAGLKHELRLERPMVSTGESPTPGRATA